MKKKEKVLASEEKLKNEAEAPKEEASSDEKEQTQEEPKRKVKRSVKKKLEKQEQEKEKKEAALEDLLHRKKRKRLLFLTSFIAVALIAALVVILHPATDIIPYYRPDPIQEDKWALTPTEAAKAKQEYEEDDKRIKFEYGKLSRMLDDENYKEKGNDDPGQFFKEFIDSIKAGDWESYQRFFEDGYFTKNEKKDGMTPQKLYHVEILYDDESENIKAEYNGKTYNVENFKVRYKILDNDRTFRNDMRGNQWVPQIIQVTKTDDGYRIVNISYEVVR